MEICKICNRVFSNLYGLRTHIFVCHKIKSKDYYDLHLLKNKSNHCVICDNITSFRGLGLGYLKHCSTQCRDKNKDIKHNYWLGKKQSKETIAKRVKNTNQIKKEEKRKNTLIDRYGFDNPAKIPASKIKLSIISKNSKKPRSKDWQLKIIDSKIKNGTLKHSDTTKQKIKEKINESLKKDFDRSKFISINNNKNCINGWYKSVFFRSSLELSFLYHFKDFNIVSCENKKYGILYQLNEKDKIYYPDFTDGKFIYEVKPFNLTKLQINILKFEKAKLLYGDKFKIITEIDIPYLKKNKIVDLINSNEIILTKNGLMSLNNYKIK